MIASNNKIKAVGEIGLDYHYDGYDRDLQIRFFREQLAFANELDMPVIVHSRDAVEDTVDILSEYRPKGVVHCFSGSAETAKEILKLGMYIGFTGVLTFKNAKKALKALAEVPMDKLLMETDCPYMAPEPFRGRRCDSSMIAYTAAKAAEIKGVSVQELIDITCKNGMTMYGIN
jgi:TatD DNase family protein